jgi:hypothetical protein
MSQAMLIEQALSPPVTGTDGRVWFTAIDGAKLPAVQACVEKWELENFNPDPFPFSPRGDSHHLVDWIFQEILKIYIGDLEIPNE